MHGGNRLGVFTAGREAILMFAIKITGTMPLKNDGIVLASYPKARLPPRPSLLQRTGEAEFCLDLSRLFYCDLSAYGSIPPSSFHSRRMPNSEWLYCRIRQILSVQHRRSILLKGA